MLELPLGIDIHGGIDCTILGFSTLSIELFKVLCKLLISKLPLIQPTTISSCKLSNGTKIDSGGVKSVLPPIPVDMIPLVAS
jgi:hypothetical protein